MSQVIAREEPLLAAASGALHKGLDLSALSSRKPAIVALLLAVSYLAFGIVSFHFLLDLTWTSAFYFAVTTSLTVGYGDIDAWSPMSTNSSADDGTTYTPAPADMVFTMLYIVGGMVVMGASLGLLLESALEGSSSSSIYSRHPLAVSAALCVLLLAVGTTGICALEGHDVVHGLYWSIVTMSTVGFGSYLDEDGSRAFAAVFMLLGVSCMGNFVGELSARPLRAHRFRLEEKVISQYGDTLEEGELWELAASEQFQRLDLQKHARGGGGGAGTGVSRDAFCLAMLVRTQKLSADDLRRCQTAFDVLDADGSGSLDMEDVRAHRLAQQASVQYS